MGRPVRSSSQASCTLSTATARRLVKANGNREPPFTRCFKLTAGSTIRQSSLRVPHVVPVTFFDHGPVTPFRSSLHLVPAGAYLNCAMNSRPMSIYI